VAPNQHVLVVQDDTRHRQMCVQASPAPEKEARHGCFWVETHALSSLTATLLPDA